MGIMSNLEFKISYWRYKRNIGASSLSPDVIRRIKEYDEVHGRR